MIFKRQKKSKQDNSFSRRQLKDSPSLRFAGNYRSGKTLAAIKSKEYASVPDLSMRDLSAHRRKVAGLFLTVVAISLFLIGLAWQLISAVEFSTTGGVRVGSYDCYQVAVKDYFNKRPTERLRLFLNQNGLLASLQAHCPEVSSINNLQVNFLRPTGIVIDFKEPVAMWTLGGTKYYVDKHGAAFLINYFDDPQIEVIDKSGLDPSKVPTVASSQLLGFIGQVVALSTDKSLVAEKIIIPPLSTRQIEVYYKEYDFPVKMLTSGSAPKQVEDAGRVMNHLKNQAITPKYVDVRIDRQAYYQ